MATARSTFLGQINMRSANSKRNLRRNNRHGSIRPFSRDVFSSDLCLNIMMDLGEDEIIKIREIFDGKPTGLNLYEFINALNSISRAQLNELDLATVHQLAELFHQIDINGDDTVTWPEFSEFIIRHTIYRPNLDHISSLYRTESVTCKQTQKERNYLVNVEKAIYLEPINKLLTCGSDKVAILWCVDDGRLIKVLKGHYAAVLNGCHVKSNDSVSGQIVTSAADRTLLTWDDATFARKVLLNNLILYKR